MAITDEEFFAAQSRLSDILNWFNSFGLHSNLDQNAHALLHEAFAVLEEGAQNEIETHKSDELSFRLAFNFFDYAILTQAGFESEAIALATAELFTQLYDTEEEAPIWS